MIQRMALSLAIVMALPAGTKAGGPDTPDARRQEALHADPHDRAAHERLLALSRDPDAMVRRAAVRTLAKEGAAALPALREIFGSDRDPLVRRTILRLAAPLTTGADLHAWLTAGEADESDLVRTAAIGIATAIAPRGPEITALLEKGRGDASHRVSRLAANALWNFREEVSSFRDRPEYRDLPLQTVQRIALPAEGWRFAHDASLDGHLKGWMNPAFDDTGWGAIGIGRSWQEAGYRHEGCGWYRVGFDLPERMPQSGVDLVFEAVDESAWIWLNGVFLGGHDLGAAGYDRMFAVDTRDLLKWGEQNVLVVRVLKPVGGHAGIWKPVYLEVLKSDEHLF